MGLLFEHLKKSLGIPRHYIIKDRTVYINKSTIKTMEDEQLLKEYKEYTESIDPNDCPLTYDEWLSKRISVQTWKDRADTLTRQPTPEENFKTVTDSICKVLTEKNKRYGNSALNPLNIFNGKCKVGARLDDKITRIQNSPELRKNDIADLLGYLILTCVEKGFMNFDDQID